MNVIDASNRFNIGNNKDAASRKTTEVQNNGTLNTNQAENNRLIENESEFTLRVNNKNEKLKNALEALKSGDNSILPEEERQKLETKAPGYARVIQGRIDNIQSSITEENRDESEEKIKSLQNILNTINGINNYFENKKQNENQDDVSQETSNLRDTIPREVDTEKKSFPTNEFQEILDRFENYLKPDAYSSIPGSTIEEKIENVKQIIKWMQDNIDSLPNEIKEKAKFALNKFKIKLNAEIGKKLSDEYKNEKEKSINLLKVIDKNITEYLNRKGVASTILDSEKFNFNKYLEEQQKTILLINQSIEDFKKVKKVRVALDKEFEAISEEDRSYMAIVRVSYSKEINEILNKYKNEIAGQEIIAPRLQDALISKNYDSYTQLKNKIDMVTENIKFLE